MPRLMITVHIARIVIDATARTGRAIDVDAFAGRDVRGKAVLVRTGWDVHWATPRYADGHPFLRMPWSPE